MSAAGSGWEFRREMFSQGAVMYAEYCEAVAEACAGAARRLERFAGGGTPGLGRPAPRSPADFERDIRYMAEKNRELKEALEVTEARLQRCKRQYTHYKQDQKLLREEVKETHEAFLTAKKYYKKNLYFYYAVESSTEKTKIIYIQWFTKERKTDMENFLLRIERNTETGRNELMELTPMLATFKSIKKRLTETNDVPGALCCIRQSFLNIRRKS